MGYAVLALFLLLLAVYALPVAPMADNVRTNGGQRAENPRPKLSKDKLSKDKLIEDTRAPVEAVPLNDGTEWVPTTAEYEEYKRLYASVNVANEFKKIRAWCLSNPAKKKTKAGVKRFVNAWLAREQDKPKHTDVLPSYLDTTPDEEQKQFTAEELERLIHG